MEQYASMLVTDLIFILGGAFFLWLTRNSPLTDITTFKEATNLMLNILGPASLRGREKGNGTQF